jgi:ATP-binding cassette subfamily F protein 3
MHRVATSVVEVRDGSVKNYYGNYDSYLQSVEKEVDDGERERAKTQQSKNAGSGKPKSDYRQQQRDQRKAEKEIKNLEKRIARLDDQKRDVNDQLMSESNPERAVELHEQLTQIAAELESAEERWMELSAEQ